MAEDKEKTYAVRRYSQDELYEAVKDQVKRWQEQLKAAEGREVKRLEGLLSKSPEKIATMLRNQSIALKVQTEYPMEYYKLAKDRPNLLDFPFEILKEKDLLYVLERLYTFRDYLNDRKIAFFIFKMIMEEVVNYDLTMRIYHLDISNEYYDTARKALESSDKRLTEWLDRLKIAYTKEPEGKKGIFSDELKKDKLSEEEKIKKSEKALKDDRRTDNKEMEDHYRDASKKI